MIVRTQATTGQGLDDLVGAIERFREQSPSVESRRRDRAAAQLRSIVAAARMRQVESRVPAAAMETLVDRIAARTLDPYAAAEEVLREVEPRTTRSGAGRGAATK
jgi:LAO/AO transport system kinase